MGADIVKTYYCDDFEKVTSTCPVPNVIAGGPKLETIKDALELTYNAMNQGAVGVEMGRKIWQSDYPEAIRAINGIDHNDLSVKEALELYSHLLRAKYFNEYSNLT